MFEERNIYMTDKFVNMLMETNYILWDDQMNVHVNRYGNFFYPPHYTDESDVIFCDVEGYNNTGIKTFHDYEYLYEVGKTYKMRGKCHKALKHNVNIFSNRLDSRFDSDSSYEKGSFDDILDIHREWILTDIDMQKNNSLMISMITNHIELFSRVSYKVFYLQNEPVGFTLHDTSPSYVHLFFTYAVPSVEYLQDYMTWMFFRDRYKTKETRLVNFGGVYGDSNIKKDKDRLCPYVVRDRWSWGNGICI